MLGEQLRFGKLLLVARISAVALPSLRLVLGLASAVLAERVADVIDFFDRPR